MSDFDKEAEREKLREKYERDKRKREATEQMSELLLQGATMTNAHCSDCGDPVFRYDGQEFCPTCEKPIERDTADDGETADGDTADDGETADGDAERIEVTSPSDDARVAFGSQEPANAAEPDSEPDGANADGRPQTPRSGHQGGTSPRQPQPPHEPQSVDPEPAPEPADEAAGTAAARDSLVRTLTRFSRQAEAAEDPRQARTHLEAAREAAEALAALRQ